LDEVHGQGAPAEVFNQDTSSFPFEVFEDAGDFGPEVLEAWDALAESLSKPFCSPAWVLAWWRHRAPRRGRLAVVIVEDHSGNVVGVAPFFIDRRKPLPAIRMMSAQTATGIDVLCVPGVERQVAESVMSALRSRARWTAGIVFDGVPASSPWPSLLAGLEPHRRRRSLPEWRQPAPIVRWSGDGDSWAQSRSSHFRRRMRYQRRRIEREGGKILFHNTPDPTAIANFIALHEENWKERGGSGVLGHGSEAMLVEAAAQLGPKGRFALWTIEVEDATACSLAFISAGDRADFWLGGYDETWSHLSPTLVALFAAIQELVDSGIPRVSLGSGAQPYKYRFTSDEQELIWTVASTGPLSVIASRLMFLKPRTRNWLSAHLPDRTKQQIKNILSGS
jgi:CelD/BcsL family acetyltransferase involved in cellulose biosynthesis